MGVGSMLLVPKDCISTQLAHSWRFTLFLFVCIAILCTIATTVHPLINSATLLAELDKFGVVLQRGCRCVREEDRPLISFFLSLGKGGAV